MQPDEGRILDIILAADDIAEYVAGKSFDDYLKTSLLRAGVERKVYIIGEAVRQLSEAFKGKHPSIPWARIVGARNVLAHEYGRVKNDIIWEVATNHARALAEYLKPFGPHEVEE